MTKTDGSALSIVVGIMSMLMIYSVTNWYAAMFLLESMRKRVEHEQQTQLIKSFLDWGVLCGKAHYETFLRQQRTKLECGAWPPGSPGCEGKISFKTTKDALAITATLAMKKNDAISSITKKGSCILVSETLPDQTKTFFVKDMQWS